MHVRMCECVILEVDIFQINILLYIGLHYGVIYFDYQLDVTRHREISLKSASCIQVGDVSYSSNV